MSLSTHARYAVAGRMRSLHVLFRVVSISLPSLIILKLHTKGMGLHEMWQEGFGDIHADRLMRIGSTEIGTALVSNSPQLFLSTVYFSYNQLLTSMMMASEYNDFAITRKALRVSEPKGEQRSTYYLQLPYRYAIPLIVSSGVLHWLTSQALFQVKIIFFSYTGELQPHLNLTTCKYVLCISGARL